MFYSFRASWQRSSVVVKSLCLPVGGGLEKRGLEAGRLVQVRGSGIGERDCPQGGDGGPVSHLLEAEKEGGLRWAPGDGCVVHKNPGRGTEQSEKTLWAPAVSSVAVGNPGEGPALADVDLGEAEEDMAYGY